MRTWDTEHWMQLWIGVLVLVILHSVNIIKVYQSIRGVSLNWLIEGQICRKSFYLLVKIRVPVDFPLNRSIACPFILAPRLGELYKGVVQRETKKLSQIANVVVRHRDCIIMCRCV